MPTVNSMPPPFAPSSPTWSSASPAAGNSPPSSPSRRHCGAWPTWSRPGWPPPASGDGSRIRADWAAGSPPGRRSGWGSSPDRVRPDADPRRFGRPHTGSAPYGRTRRTQGGADPPPRPRARGGLPTGSGAAIADRAGAHRPGTSWEIPGPGTSDCTANETRLHGSLFPHRDGSRAPGARTPGTGRGRRNPCQGGALHQGSGVTIWSCPAVAPTTYTVPVRGSTATLLGWRTVG